MNFTELRSTLNRCGRQGVQHALVLGLAASALPKDSLVYLLVWWATILYAWRMALLIGRGLFLGVRPTPSHFVRGFVPPLMIAFGGCLIRALEWTFS